MGQVVLLSGEAGIGKSRLVQVLTGGIATDPGVADAVPVFALSPNTALYPMIDLLERVVLGFEREEEPAAEAAAGGGFVVQYGCRWRGRPFRLAPSPSPLPADYAPPAPVARAAEAADPARPARHPATHCGPSSRCSLSWKTCTGSIRPRWSSSASWSIKAPPPASGAVTFRPDFSPPWTGRFAPHPAHGQPLAPTPGRRGDAARWPTARRYHPRWSSRSWPRPMGYPVCGGIDQDGPGVGTAPGARRAL